MQFVIEGLVGVEQRDPQAGVSDQQAMADDESEAEVGGVDHLTIPDEALKSKIIGNWGAELDPEMLHVLVCAVCGIRESKRNMIVVDGRCVDFSLLRNDDLPAHLRPVSYNFLAYDRAILNPRGLTSTEVVAELNMCIACHEAVESRTMPKFALCNWLYYGKDRLPGDLESTFRDLSMFERMLISRARCNSVCCKFRVDEGTSGESALSRLRKGIRGNVLVAPLDVMRLHKVLPPHIDQYRDTMSAVFVSEKMPTRSTIERLSPVLVRKSRVQRLLAFLLANNPHYGEDTGLTFSRENLDAIHSNGEEAALPGAVTIAQLAGDSAYVGVNSEYAPHNEIELVPEERLSELVMENVSYTEGDESPQAYQAMKLKALERCLSGKSFLVSGTGSRPVPDFHNPSILTWLFPQLDPWGIGGFHEPRRRIRLSMKEQLGHLLRSDDTSFEEDPEFAFVFYNVIRKAEVARSVRFQVPEREQARIIGELKTVDVSDVLRLCKSFDHDARYKVSDGEEKRIMRLMRSITMSTHSLPGSNGYKRMMRDQIRSIIFARGAPTLFLTINPSDVDHPIVRILAGEDVNLDDMWRGETLDSWRRKVLAARKPAACALFFDMMIRTFVKVILRHGTGEKGLYGRCEAYYGTVEAQGKGTLHCHMLIWLRGHLAPEMLRSMLASSEDYRAAFVSWIESVISNEFPVVGQMREEEPVRDVRVRSKDVGEPHPGAIFGPSMSVENHESRDEYWTQYNEQLIRLLNEYNWHEHTATCFKYLKAGQKKSDDNCRLRMDGRIYPETLIDDVTGAIQVRRLHPKISSYTDVVTFLMKCNMNVQFVGSGDAARAFLYYVTDYVTKTDLPVREGLAALAYVLQKKLGPATVSGNTDQANVAAMTKLVNGMMGKQEISHQQVMSYLVGGGDYYTSERFHHLYLGAFLRSVDVALREVEVVDASQDQGESGAEQQLELDIDRQQVSVNSQVDDYCYRPVSEPYASMCLYEFVAATSKSKVADTDRLLDSPHAFSSWDHPQRGTHKVASRSKRVLPVVLGPSLPNRSASDGAWEVWAKYVLVMFKPWRTANDLKGAGQTWRQAYDELDLSLSSAHRKVIQNMTLLSECRDASFSLPRTDLQAAEPVIAQEDGDMLDDGNEATEAAADDVDRWNERYSSNIFEALESGNQVASSEPVPGDGDVSTLVVSTLGRSVADSLDFLLRVALPESASVVADVAERYDVDIHVERLSVYRSEMTLKRKRQVEQGEEGEVGPRRKRTRGVPATPFVVIDALGPAEVMRNRAFHSVVEQVVTEMSLADNAEQLNAFMTVAKHLAERSSEQLLMFVSGVGGTGKSHVIKSIVKLFERLHQRQSLLLGAPTGSAAVLIGGHTLHSLILENVRGGNKKNMATLTAIWRNVSYLIGDEVSMMSAIFLSKLSSAMCRAKYTSADSLQKLFGGVNVIFMGDLCQLKPPVQRAIYASRVLTWGAGEGSMDAEKISAMNGIFIWRQVKTMIELVKNCRHLGDPAYSAFLSRLRVGRCLGSAVGRTGAVDDYAYLQTRLLLRIQHDSPEELQSFADAPFIVGSRVLRDLMNSKLVIFNARRKNRTVETYYSKDYCRKDRVCGSHRQYLLNLHSSFVKDSFGRLPLFEGMKVMVTENIALDSKLVNGTEGVVKNIVYEEDTEGRRYATVVYIHVDGIGFKLPGLDQDVVPIFPTKTYIEHSDLRLIGLNTSGFTRLQMPLVPAYSYTDFKSQGRTLSRAVVDLASAKGQGVYVMLSRVTSLSGLAILRWFSPAKVYTRLSQDLRDEMGRLGCRL